MPYGKLFSVIESIGSNTLTLELTGDKLAIRFNTGVFNLMGMDPKEFPPVDRKMDVSADMSATELVRILDGTMHCASRDMIACASYAGIYFGFEHTPAHFVATDGRRLSKMTGDALAGLKPVTIPISALEKMYDIIKSIGAETVTIQQGEHWRIQFLIKSGTDTITFASPLLEGQFPPYENVIPNTEVKTTVTINRELLISACNQARILSNTDGEIGSRIVLAIAGATCRASGRDQSGDGAVDVPCEIKGDAVTTAFGDKFLIPCLKSMTAENVTLELRGAIGLMVIKGDAGMLQIVMSRKA